MKILKLGVLILLGFTMGSCGGNQKAVETEREKVAPVEAKTAILEPYPGSAVLGDYAKYFTFTGENGEADITLQGIPLEVEEFSSMARGTIKAVVKIKIDPMPEKMHGFASVPLIPLYIFNGDKEQPGGSCRLEMVDADESALEALIKEGKGGEITVTYKQDFYDETYDKIFEEAKYYRIESVNLRTEREHNNRSNSSVSSGSYGNNYSADDNEDDNEGGMVSTSSSNNNWDELLDEYERYVDDLLSLSAKIKKGDPSAAADYASLINDCQSISNKLSNAKGNLSPAQIKRLNRIASKYANLAK